jgi:hypothetical protein
MACSPFGCHVAEKGGRRRLSQCVQCLTAPPDGPACRPRLPALPASPGCWRPWRQRAHAAAPAAVLGTLVAGLDTMDEETFGLVEGCLLRMGELVAEDIMDYVTDRCEPRRCLQQLQLPGAAARCRWAAGGA